ncbi:MAG: hypothetical protein Q8R36_03400 [bacterium]|nr:hypothetical protein [bacterium]
MAKERLTNLSPEELEKMHMLSQRVLCDYRDPRRGAYRIVYVYSHTKDNEASTFLKAVELVEMRAKKLLGIAEGDLGHGYEGFDHSIERLREFGFQDQVPIVKLGMGNVNTGSEARVLATYVNGMQANKATHGDVGIIAPPFHLVRAFITTVTAILREEGLTENDQKTRVYAIPGVSLPWMQTVAHSQGTLVRTRAELLEDELKRLEAYRAEKFGSMLSAEKVLAYLNWRDC